MEVVVRELHEPGEILPVEELQAAIWGDPDDVMPARSMMAMAHEGALVAGAFLGSEMVGFVFGFPTADPKRHHSHMMGVLEAHRGTPAALLLKRFQRDWCLSRGYEVVAWTFDPLRGVNANFNLRKLGVTFGKYIPDCYGEMTGINAGAPSDRADVDWEIRSERVFRRIYAPEPLPHVEGLPYANTVQDEQPVALNLGLEAPRLLLQIPEDWGQVLQHDKALALAWREHSRALFGHYFARGYRVTDFVRFPNRYVLERSG